MLVFMPEVSRLWWAVPLLAARALTLGAHNFRPHPGCVMHWQAGCHTHTAVPG